MVESAVIIVIGVLVLTVVYLYKLHIKCWIDTIKYRRIYLKAQHARYRRKYR